MSTSVKAEQFAKQAIAGNYLGIPYEVLDCQGFVEKVLADCGVVNPSTGKAYNWTGSNKMWRVALSWKGTYDECIRKFGKVPDGAWLFHVVWDGGEKERGYNDNAGNAKHVGIKISGAAESIHSTNGGVQYAKCPDPKRWTHVGLAKMIIYDDQEKEDDPNWKATVNAKAVALRKEPSVDSKILVRVPSGEKVDLPDPPEAEWTYIEYNGIRGWMMSKFLDKRGEGDA